MKEEKATIKVFMPDYTVISNTKEETKILETEIRFAEMAETYTRELAIKKDNAILTTWFNSLKDNELLHIHTLLETIMKERNIIQ